MTGGRSNGTANFRAIILHRGAQGLRGIHMPLGWVERRGFYFPGMACQRAPAQALLSLKGNRMPVLTCFHRTFFFGGVNKWRNYETMRHYETLWETMRNYKKLWGSGPRWQLFVWSPLCRLHRHQEELPSCLDGEWEPISYKHPSPGCGKGHDFTHHNSKPQPLSLHRPCPILENPLPNRVSKMFLPDSQIMSFLVPFINIFLPCCKENNILQHNARNKGASTSGRMSTILHEVVKYCNNDTLCW